MAALCTPCACRATAHRRARRAVARRHRDRCAVALAAEVGDRPRAAGPGAARLSPLDRRPAGRRLRGRPAGVVGRHVAAAGAGGAVDPARPRRAARRRVGAAAAGARCARLRASAGAVDGVAPAFPQGRPVAPRHRRQRLPGDHRHRGAAAGFHRGHHAGRAVRDHVAARPGTGTGRRGGRRADADRDARAGATDDRPRLRAAAGRRRPLGSHRADAHSVALGPVFRQRTGRTIALRPHGRADGACHAAQHRHATAIPDRHRRHRGGRHRRSDGGRRLARAGRALDRRHAGRLPELPRRALRTAAELRLHGIDGRVGSGQRAPRGAGARCRRPRRRRAASAAAAGAARWRRVVLRRHRLWLRDRTPGAARGRPRGPRRRNAGARRRKRRRQNDAGGAGAAAARPLARSRVDRRPRPARRDAGQHPRARRRGAAGRAHPADQHRRQHRLRTAVGDARRDRVGGLRRALRRLRRCAAAGLRHRRRRAWHDAVGRAAPAHRDRARAAEGRAGAGDGRTDECARHPDRT